MQLIGQQPVTRLIGLEPLETQRCLPYLHNNSSVIFGNYRVQPYSVNAQMAAYPDVGLFGKYLEQQCREVVFINQFPESINSVLYNIFLLGRATRMKDFPFGAGILEEAINNVVTGYYKEKSLMAFQLGVAFEMNGQPA